MVVKDACAGAQGEVRCTDSSSRSSHIDHRPQRLDVKAQIFDLATQVVHIQLSASNKIDIKRGRLHGSPAALVLRPVGGVGEVEEGPDLDVLLGWVAHVQVLIDAVAVAASVAFAFDVSGLDQVGEDALRGSLGDPDLLGDVAEPDVWRAGDADQHLCVVGEEAPGALVRT